MIQPIRELLFSAMQGDHLSVDNNWNNLMTRQIKSAEVELIAILGEANLRVEDVMKIRNGDIIPININDTITATINNVPVMECKYGVFNDRYSIRVDQILSHSINDAVENGGGK